MLNEKLFETYREDILSLFRQQYKKLSVKNVQLAFTDVLEATLEELGFSSAPSEQADYLREWFERIHSLSFILNLTETEELNELILHSHQHAQLIGGSRKWESPLLNLTPEDYQLSLEILAIRNNISWNYSDPFASFSLKLHGRDFRATLIHFSTSPEGISKIFLRAMKQELPTLNLFSLDHEQNELLRSLVRDKKNILISGSTGSGKTTFLRALLKEVSPEEHIIILEDTHEIQPTYANQTSMLAQVDCRKKSLKDYCAYALRMSPDRLIVGEMRSTEVVPFMLAMNTGHKGLMSTIHANSCSDALSRIALLFSLYSENKQLDFSLITKLACKNIDYVVHLENKKIVEVARILGSEGETPFYETVYSSLNHLSEYQHCGQ